MLPILFPSAFAKLAACLLALHWLLAKLRTDLRISPMTKRHSHAN